MQKLRVFVAIPLPEVAAKAINEKIARERRDFGVARWTPVANWHITVLQPQQWDEDEVRYYIDTLQDRVRQKPFSLICERIKLGPNAKSPSMVWAVMAPSKECAALAREVRRILDEAGAQLDVTERTKDTIHITLARFNPIFKDRVIWQDKELRQEVPVRALEVLRSDLRPDGARYTKLGEIQLP